MSENSLRIDGSRKSRQALSMAASAACSVKPRWRGRVTVLLPHGGYRRWFGGTASNHNRTGLVILESDIE